VYPPVLTPAQAIPRSTLPTNSIASTGTRKSSVPVASSTSPTASTPAALHLSAMCPTNGRIVKLGTAKTSSARPAMNAEPPMSCTYSGMMGVSIHWFA
jgi:hypothetical protein